MQEAYHPLRSKCSLCCPNGGGYPIQSWVEGCTHPVLAVTGGYPIQSWLGVPHPRSRWGVPHHPVLAGGYPIQSWPGGYPIPGPGGYPPSAGWGTPLDLGLGTPSPSRPGMEYTLQLDGVPPPPPPGPGMGYPPRPDPGLPPPIEVWTDKQNENSTFPHPSGAGRNNDWIW